MIFFLGGGRTCFSPRVSFLSPRVSLSLSLPVSVSLSLIIINSLSGAYGYKQQLSLSFSLSISLSLSLSLSLSPVSPSRYLLLPALLGDLTLQQTDRDVIVKIARVSRVLINYS